MSRKVKVTVKNHCFKGTAILRNFETGELREVDLGTLAADKKMSEKGMEKEFVKLCEVNPVNKIVAIDVSKLDDEEFTYQMDIDTFIKNAELVKVDEE